MDREKTISVLVIGKIPYHIKVEMKKNIIFKLPKVKDIKP
jgi:hypothetical protein